MAEGNTPEATGLVDGSGAAKVPGFRGLLGQKNFPVLLGSHGSVLNGAVRLT